MRRIFLVLLFLLTGWLVAIRPLTTQPAAAAPQSTAVCGALTSSTTWTAANSPYLVCNTFSVTVNHGITLTIEPGVTVSFATNARLFVYGNLIAQGTAVNPITFTGDPTPGSWGGIVVNNFGAGRATAVLDQTILQYGGFNSSTGSQISIDNGVLTMTNSLLQNGGGSGIYVLSDNNPAVSDTTFQNHAFDVARLIGSRGDLRFQRITATGNNQNVIRIAGYSNMSGRHTWQAADIPYLFTGSAGNEPGDILTIEPGTEARFSSGTGLEIGGHLSAIGLPTAPITFTGITNTPGAWRGINVEGTNAGGASAVFEYATIAYGGLGWDEANVRIRVGQVQMRHSIVRNGGNDGIRNVGYGNSGTTIETTQILNNAGVGLNNLEPTWPLLAANNWWGSASGPTLPNGSPCGPGGTGSRISNGVIFRPVLAAANAQAAPASADDQRLLTITPLRWFAPATGVDRIYAEIRLLDGRGDPIPGRTVQMGSTLGTVVDGGVTGADGKTLAYVRSSVVGDAALTAVLQPNGACELVRSPTAKVTFTAAGEEQGYLPQSAAPYLNAGIEINPAPVIQGVPTTLSVRVTNPNSYPIEVNGAFSYFQSSIGLTFGPLANLPPATIPANGEAVLSTLWTPPLSGNFCIQFDYTALAARMSGVEGVTAVTAGGSVRKNLKSFPGKGRSSAAREAYETSRKAVSAMSNANDGLSLLTDPAGFIGGFIPGQLFGHITDFWYDMMDQIDEALKTDPPRQDYNIITPPQPVTPPILAAGNGISVAKAAAANAYVAAAMDYYQYARAAALANDRYGGATEANSVGWAAQQLSAVIYYERESAFKMLTVADTIDAYVAVVLAENPGDIWMTPAIYTAYQQRLATTGFTADEVAAAHLLGMTDEQIEAVRQQRLAVNPATMSFSVTQRLTEFAYTLRALSSAILSPPDPMFFVGGGAGRQAAGAAGGDNLVLLGMQETTILLGNPHAVTETVQAVVRPIDMPPDWIVTVSPSVVVLGPGTAVTLTVKVEPGARVAQGSTLRFAVEGYIGTELIGGVVFDTLAPPYVPFATNFVYLPMVMR